MSDVDGANGGGGESWHRGARRMLAEKAKRAVEEAEKLEAMIDRLGVGGSDRRARATTAITLHIQVYTLGGIRTSLKRMRISRPMQSTQTQRSISRNYPAGTIQSNVFLVRQTPSLPALRYPNVRNLNPKRPQQHEPLFPCRILLLRSPTLISLQFNPQRSQSLNLLSPWLYLSFHLFNPNLS